MATFKITEVLTLGANSGHKATTWKVYDEATTPKTLLFESVDDGVNLLTLRTALFYPNGSLVDDCTYIKARVKVRYGDNWSPYFDLNPIPANQDIVRI